MNQTVSRVNATLLEKRKHILAYRVDVDDDDSDDACSFPPPCFASSAASGSGGGARFGCSFGLLSILCNFGASAIVAGSRTISTNWFAT